ncbi:hypothetical protein RmaAA338_08320 [Rhodothermus marinus]|nr:hypothetical protein RmaAA338_08320 [Rhodothermus marinus]
MSPNDMAPSGFGWTVQASDFKNLPPVSAHIRGDLNPADQDNRARNKKGPKWAFLKGSRNKRQGMNATVCQALG